MRVPQVLCNGQALRSLNGQILVQNVIDNTPQAELSWGDNPGRAGQRLLGRRRVSRRVDVVYAIRELRDPAARASIVDLVNGWAEDGVLEVSNRPNQRLRVVCTARAAIQKPMDYTEQFTVSFEASPWPYWEDLLPTMLAMTGSNGSGNLLNPGTAPSYVSASVTPSGGTLNTLTLTVGDTSFSLSGLGVASGNELTIGYDERGILRIRSGNLGLLGCRSETSSDDLIALPKRWNAVSFTANTSCNARIEVRGSWL